MSIIRVNKDERYFTTSNEPFNDTTLSWDARGVIGYLLSKPNGWEIRMDDLRKKGPAGATKLRRIMKELYDHLYVNRIRVTLPDQKFDWESEVYESPSLNPRKNEPKPAEKASRRFCTRGASKSGKPAHKVITKESKTEAPKKARRTPTPKPTEVELYREVVKHYPIRENDDKVVAAVQKIADRLGRPVVVDDLAPYFSEWCTRSPNVYNLAWLLEWAVQGKIPTYRNQPKPIETPPDDHFMEDLERRRQQVKAESV
jgi:hypothetical protein